MAPEEPPIVIENREQLVYLLSEAAEIEHGLMACYLYAAYSLKRGAPEHSDVERAAVERWRAAILDVARDEMVHLALVSNLLSAVGSAPHLLRPNFPVAPGYHPAGVVVSLAPFAPATLDHFIFLERPEGVSLVDGSGFATGENYFRTQARGRLVPSAQDFLTVGHLYRGIRAGFTTLAKGWGEDALFVGEPARQLDPTTVAMAGLTGVRTLSDAWAAVDTIVSQGEGSGADSGDQSHYAKFLKVRRELEMLTRANPSFSPAHPAAYNPVMRRPTDATHRVWITAEPAASFLDAGNALYALMLRSLLALYSSCARDREARAVLADLSMTAMRLMAVVAERLAALPATNDPQGPNAGLTFTMSRSLHAPPDRGALRLIAEDARDAGKKLRELDPPGLTSPERLERLAERLVALSKNPPAATAPKPIDPLSATALQRARDAPPAPAGESPAVDAIAGKALTVLYEGERCIHSRHCVLGAPDVFRANTPGAWIFPDSATPEALIEIAHACPSGAIRYQRHDGGPDEQPPPVNVMRIRENGPLALHAQVRLDGQAMFRTTLCRCGASKNKPYCDGSHVTLPFTATGEPSTGATEPLAVRNGELEVAPQQDGPLSIIGNLEVCAGTGHVIARVDRAAFCRCGGSSHKPFCDGTHAKIGFRAPGA